MQTDTSTTTPTSATPAAAPRMIGEADRKGYRLTTWMSGGMSGVDLYSVEVADPGAADTAKSFGPGLVRGRVELEAERWVDAQAELASRRPGAANEPAPPPLIVKGWRLEVSADGRGDFRVVLSPHVGVDGAPPEAEEFAGYQYRDIAVKDASAWCDAHPLRVDGESPGGFAWWASWYGGESAQGYRFTVIHAMQVRGALIEGVHVFASAEECCTAAEVWCATYKPGEALPPEVPAVPVIAPAEGGVEGVDAIEAVAPPIVLPTAPAPLVAAAPPSPGAAKDFEETTSAAEQYFQIGQEIAEKENELEALKAELKSLIKQRDLRALKMSNGLRAMRDVRSAGPYQVRLPIEQATLAVEAPKVVAELKHQGPEVPWVLNAVEHVILVRELEPGKWRAALRGHEVDTEGFDVERSKAIETCQARASMYFEGCEPGSTEVPKPKGRKKASPKRVEELPPPAAESPDAPRVIAALRSAMNTGEAAKMLKRSEQTLRKWCAENGVAISEHLSRDIGQDEPAQKASKRGRGRGRKAK